ncbi:MAG: histidine phosphatase family protein [Gemmatimonadota bacterium]
MGGRIAVVAAALLAASAGVMTAQAGTVIVIRHAEKRTDQGSDPELTERGEHRAEALVAALRDAHVTAVITTELRRNVLTAAPLARAAGVTPLVIRAGSDPAAHGREVAEALRRLPRGAVAVVIEHSNTVPGVIAAMGGPAIPEFCDSEFATMLVASLGHGRVKSLVRATYGEHDSLSPQCSTMK